jgi:hypothetical protein
MSETDATVQNINKGQSRRPHSSTDNESVATVLQASTQSPKKSVWKCSHDNGIPKTSIHCILWHEKWKPYVPRLFHGTKENDPDHQMEFCECFLNMYDERESFPISPFGLIKTLLNLMVLSNKHNHVHWTTENPHGT